MFVQYAQYTSARVSHPYSGNQKIKCLQISAVVFHDLIRSTNMRAENDQILCFGLQKRYQEMFGVWSFPQRCMPANYDKKKEKTEVVYCFN